VRDNIIGQFGVGFYSSFIVADLVEVISKEEGQQAHKWESDGSGTFQISEVE
jgi:molecular chaperone HtpG